MFNISTPQAVRCKPKESAQSISNYICYIGCTNSKHKLGNFGTSAKHTYISKLLPKDNMLKVHAQKQAKWNKDNKVINHFTRYTG